MRSGEEEDDSGESSVETETDQTKPVNHHGGKLPVIDHQLLLVLLSQSACHRPQLLQDHLHLGREEGDEGGAGDVVPVAAAAVVVRLHDVGVSHHVVQGPETEPVRRAEHSQSLLEQISREEEGGTLKSTSEF